MFRRRGIHNHGVMGLSQLGSGCPGADVVWLLRDDFTDTLAAGSVNGTPATPGPGTRTVVDTGSQLSVGGGTKNFVAGAATPAIYYGLFVRVAGRLVVSSLYVTGGRGGYLGWGVGGTGTDGLVLNLSSRIDARVNNIAVNGVGTWAALTQYKVSVVLRTAGIYAFLKTGAGNWILMWVGGTAGFLYPTHAAASTSDANAMDFMRIPDELWLPTPAAYDAFTRADGALGSTEATGPDGQITPVWAWTNQVGTTSVATFKAQASALVGGIAIATVDTGAADVVASATLTRAGGNVGLVLRYQDADNYVFAYHDGTNCALVKRVATIETTVITAAVAIGAGALVAICSGTSWSLYLNNVQVGTTQTIAQLTTGTRQGMYSTNVGNTQDLFQVFPRGTGNEYSALDRWSQ